MCPRRGLGSARRRPSRRPRATRPSVAPRHRRARPRRFLTLEPLPAGGRGPGDEVERGRSRRHRTPAWATCSSGRVDGDDARRRRGRRRAGGGGSGSLDVRQAGRPPACGRGAAASTSHTVIEAPPLLATTSLAVAPRNAAPAGTRGPRTAGSRPPPRPLPVRSQMWAAVTELVAGERGASGAARTRRRAESRAQVVRRAARSRRPGAALEQQPHPRGPRSCARGGQDGDGSGLQSMDFDVGLVAEERDAPLARGGVPDVCRGLPRPWRSRRPSGLQATSWTEADDGGGRGPSVPGLRRRRR